jgi:hypothetical protein
MFESMFRRLLLVVVIALLAAFALMIGRSATVPVQLPTQSTPPMDSDARSHRYPGRLQPNQERSPMTKAIGFAAIRHVRIGTSSTAVVLGTDTSGVGGPKRSFAWMIFRHVAGALLCCAALGDAPSPALLPAATANVAAHIAHLADAGLKASTIARHCSARARPPDSAMATVAIS